MDKEKTVEYRRTFATISHRELWIDGGKWQSLLDLLDQSKGVADTLVIDAPEVLGDTYREFVMNLTAIANAGLKILVRSGKTIVGRHSIPGVPPILEAEDAGTPPKMGGGILRIGRKPDVVLMSSAPDEIYAQAELLVMLQKEEYKPSSEGRQIEGRYETGPGTVDTFFEDWLDKPEDLKLLENKRQEIIEKGWGHFVYRGEKTPESIEQPIGSMSHRVISKNAPIDEEEPLMRDALDEMKSQIPKDKTFTCPICMEERETSLFESIGFLGIDGVKVPSGKLKSLPYPICKKCSLMPRERLFSNMEENLHAYGQTFIKSYEKKKAQRIEVEGALKVIDELIDGPRLSLMGRGFDTKDDNPASLIDATHKVKALSDQIKKAGHFTCICCLKKRPEKHLESIGAYFPKNEDGKERDQKTTVYPICDKCSKLPAGDMTEMAEKNLNEWNGA